MGRILRAAFILGLAYLTYGFINTPRVILAEGPEPVPADMAPSYAAKIKQRARWHRFPLRVAFKQDANHAPELERDALRGFDQWVDATQGVVDFDVVGSTTSANVVVRFDPERSGGLTTTRFYRDRLAFAEVIVGTRHSRSVDVEAIAAHEFGHALGLSGHSDYGRDVMYAVHMQGRPARLTERDINTLAALYPSVAKRLQAARPRE
jgi:hypothetical protein